MRLGLETDTSINLIRSYGAGEVVINDSTLHASLILSADQLIIDWAPQNFTEVTADHFKALLALDPEIVLFGTGAVQRFPHPILYSALINKGIGVEIMATDAACRTYNIIVGEGRRVAAALLMI